MASKKQTKGKKKPLSLSPLERRFQKRPTSAEAKEGEFLARLLWRKLIVNLTPEFQEMLIVWKHLDWIWDQLAPNDFHRVPKPDLTLKSLFKEIDKAEYLLSGDNFPQEIGLPDGYEIPPHMKSKESSAPYTAEDANQKGR